MHTVKSRAEALVYAMISQLIQRAKCSSVAMLCYHGIEIVCIGYVFDWFAKSILLRLIMYQFLDSMLSGTAHSPFYSATSIFAVLRNLVQEIWFEKNG